MRVFRRPIFVSRPNLLTMKGQKKLYEEHREAHKDDITRTTALPPGTIMDLEGGLTQSREEWLAAAAIELAELTQQIDDIAAYVG